MAKGFAKVAGLWRPLGGGKPSDPDDGGPPPASWQAAVDSRSFSQVEAWYSANTGYRALGYSYADLIPGSLSSSFDGQVIEGVRGGPIRIAHNNVTIRGCLVETWGTYGAYFNPTFGAQLTGNVVEYTNLEGPGGNPDQPIRGALFVAGNADAITMRYCDFLGWTSGAASDRGMTAEYCWIHDLASPEGSDAHRTSLRTSGRDVTFRRNYCTDGGSSCISVYADKNPVHNVLLEENILNGSSPNASPSYLIATKVGDFGPTATNVRYVGNMFGPEFQFGILSAGNIAWGSNGNVRSENEMFLTGELAGN